MTSIQHRRDTAANWTTANPTLLAGEIGVETDTNKFKIGDGTTAWTDLAYQGGSSETPTNMVTTDTAQTITGVKTFNSTPIANSGIQIGANSSTMITKNSANSLRLQGVNSIEFGQPIYFPAYIGKIQALRDVDIYGNQNKKSHLHIGSDDTLTYIKNDGTTTVDLLAGGAGDVVTSADNTFTGKNFFSNSEGINVSNTDGTYATVAHLGDDIKDADGTNTFLAPLELGSEYQQTYLVKGAMAAKYDSTNSEDRLYNIMTNHPDDKATMASLGFPSGKYVDLTLGASGSTYTAPADGWASAYDFTVKTNTLLAIYSKNIGHLGMRISRPSNNSYGDVYLPCAKGTTFTVEYGDQTDNSNTPHLRFFYAKGCEPTE